MKKIDWLASYPKSGNTWVRLFLTHYMLGHNDINYVQFTVGDISLGPYHRVSPVPVEMTDEAQRIFLRPAALMYMAAINQFDPCIFKTHNGHYVIHGIRLQPAEMTKSIVVIVRDPRDICVSLKDHMGFKDYDETIEFMSTQGAVLEATAGIRHYVGDWSAFHESYLNEQEAPIRFIKYEDMLHTPTACFEDILSGFSMTVVLEKVVASIEAVDFVRCKEQEVVNGFSESAPDVPFFARGTAGSWKEELTEQQADKIVAKHSAMMRYFGYVE